MLGESPFSFEEHDTVLLPHTRVEFFQSWFHSLEVQATVNGVVSASSSYS